MSGETLLTGKLAEALHGEMVPKFLATVDAQGRPNVVPIISLDAVDERTMAFGVFMIWKTQKNLMADPRVCAAVLTEDLSVWIIRGRFREFVSGGPYADLMNQKNMFRYNAYMKISEVGVIDVEEVTGSWKLSMVRVASELLPMKIAGLLSGGGNGKTIPARVAEKFSRMKSVKFLAWRDAGGYPDVIPVFSLLPTRSDRMIFGARLFRERVAAIPAGARVAASVITFDPVAYQVKGTFEGVSRGLAGPTGRIRIDEVYSASPPLPGEAIEMSTADG